MNIIKAVQLYIDKMLEGVPGMKALVLDLDTVLSCTVFVANLILIHIFSWEL